MGYFEDALSNFVQDFNYGGAIRHLTDLGYSAKAIRDKLKCPFDTVKIQEIQYRYLKEREILLPEEKIAEKGGIYARDTEKLWEEAQITGKEYGRAEAERILTEMLKERGDGSLYLDFPYGRMGDAKKEKVKNAMESPELELLLRIPWRPERVLLKADTGWIRLSVRHNHLDTIYSTYYFLDPAVTVLANAGGEYLFFTR